MDCLCGTIKGAWNFILGSIRLILFTICLVFVLVQLVWFGLLLCAKDNIGSSLPEADLNYKVLVNPILLTFVGLFGCWATFYKSDRALKLFAILTAICTIYLFFLTATSMQPEAKETEKADYIKFLKYNAQYYDWKGDGSGDSKRIVATQIWDSLQSLGCCGINEANDWDEYRPSSIGKDYFPRTCCHSRNVDKDSGLCPAKGGSLQRGGCLKVVEKLEVGHLVFHYGFLILLIILTLLSWIYIFGSV